MTAVSARTDPASPEGARSSADVFANEFSQPISYPVPTWTDRRRPTRTVIEGQYVNVEPIEPRRHGHDLFAAFALDTDGRNWTYMPYGPFGTAHALAGWMQLTCLGDDPLFHAIVDRATGKAVGLASYLRIDPKAGSAEVGHISMSPLLQGKRQATEAMYLMARRILDELAYRRYEWKCDALNAPSRRAAERLGFTYEGTFRQATVYKGRNRDTAWYAIIDRDWPAIRAELEAWLDPKNFDASGAQRTRLSSRTAAALAR